MGSTISIVIAVVAVVVGFLILRNITDDGGSADGGAVAPTESTTPSTVDTTATSSTTSTLPPLVTQGATVVVANASGVPGSAGRMTDELARRPRFATATAINSTGPQLDQSIVYYDPSVAAALDVANSVARVMGGLTVEIVPTPPPVEGESLGDASVLVLLGTAQSDRTLEELAPATSPVVTRPAGRGRRHHRRHDDGLSARRPSSVLGRADSQSATARSMLCFGAFSAVVLTDGVDQRHDVESMSHRCAERSSRRPQASRRPSPPRSPRRRRRPCPRSWCRRGVPRR